MPGILPFLIHNRRVMMYKIFVSVVTLICLTFAHASAGTSSGKITMNFDLSQHGSTKTAQVWIPYPVSNKNQTVTQVSIQGTMTASGVYTDASFQNPMLYAKWDSGIQEKKLSFSFHVQRKEVIKNDFPATEAAWDPKDYAPNLAATSLGAVDGEIKALADSITAGKKGVLEKAKAIYDWTCENTYRNPNTNGCGFGDVYRLLKDPGGKCADISSIYVALARAAGVPTREVFGIRQGKKQTQDISKWQHCWAEFYLPGYGWVPVDPADVRKMMLKENLVLSDEKTKAYQKHFWGGVDPYRLKLSEGRDLILNPPQKGEPVNYLMYPHGQVGDTILDWLDPETFSYSIVFEKI